jgi:aminopeptidase
MAGSKSGQPQGPAESPARTPTVPPSMRPRSEPHMTALQPGGNITARQSSSWRLAMVDFSLVAASRRIVEGALSVVPGETVTLIADRARLDLARAMMDAVLERNARGVLMVLEEIGARPLSRLPDCVLAQLQRSQASVFLAGFDAGERQMRIELVSVVPKLGIRHAHMVGITRKSLCTGFSADPQRIADAARSVRTRLRGDSVLRAFGVLGTELTVRCHPSHRWVEHSGVIRPGKWENLPTGEILTAPGDVRGVFNCNASMSEAFGERFGFLRDMPVRLMIESGYVRNVFCPDTRLEREIRDWLKSGDHLDRVGLVVIGTNVGMRDPVGEILCDQNLPGLHIGLGSTFPELTGAAWNTQRQLMLASAYTDVDLDGVPLIRSGRFLDLK